MRGKGGEIEGNKKEETIQVRGRREEKEGLE